MIDKHLTDDALELIAGRFRILSDPKRLRILHALGTREMNVTELVSSTGIGQANVSRHLAVLLSAGVVARRREGLTANYRVIDETIFNICDLVCSRLKTQFDDHRNSLERAS